jgi:Tfp pilus assembly protein PilO
MKNRREQLIAWVAGLLVAMLVLDQLALTPLLDRLALADEALQAQQAQLEQATRLFQNSTRARKRWKEMAGGTLRLDSSESQSRVLNSVRQWAQASGLTLTSLKPERAERQQDFQKITLRAAAHGSMAQVAMFLFSVEQASIPLRVTDVQITSRRDGMDDLSIKLGISTIHEPASAGTAAPAPASPATAPPPPGEPL